MAFSYTVTLTDPLGLAQDATLRVDMAAALDAWSRVLVGSANASLSVQLTVASDLGTGVLAEGGPGALVRAGTDGARTVYQSGALYELNTGIDPNGSAADITIAVSAQELRNGFYLNPNPAAGGAVPAGSYDLTTVLTHELAHAFGMVGYRDASTGALSAASETAWDRLVAIQADGSAVFTGAHAEAVYGGPVPVTTLQNGEQYYHLGNSAADAASADLMGGTGLPPGVARGISALDLAIMQDLGATLAGPVAGLPSDTGDGIDAVYVAVLQRHADLGEQRAWLAQEAAGLSGDQARHAIETSPEAQAVVDPVVRLYGVAFGRLPDQVGLYANVSGARTDSLTAVAENMAHSAEFAQDYGSTAVTDTFLQALYHNALGRTASSAELAAWHATGADAGQVLLGFAQSEEYQARSATGVSNFLEAAAHGQGVYTGPLVAGVASAGLTAAEVAAHMAGHDLLV